MSALDLKPCPFCGGRAERFTITDDDEVANIGGDVITCQQCNASSQVQFGEKATLAEAWNRRADLPPGYVILSPDEVRGIRDAALEEAARHARECFDDPQADADPDYLPNAIRSLKGGRDAQ